MAALRLVRGWNQTGQKFAGEPDIVKSFLITRPVFLWVLVSAAYVLLSFQILGRLQGLPYIAATSLTSVLVSSAFSFKLDFTSEDAPELVVGFAQSLNEMFQGQSLLWRARTVFILIAVLGAYGVFRLLTAGRDGRIIAGKFTRLLFAYSLALCK